MARRLEWLFGATWRLPLLVALFIAAPILVLGEVSAADTRRQVQSEQTQISAATAARAADQMRVRADNVGLQILLASGVGDMRAAFDSQDRTLIAELVRRTRRLLPSEVLRLLALDTAFGLVAVDPPGTPGEKTAIDPDYLFRLQRNVVGDLVGYSALYPSGAAGNPSTVATGLAVIALNKDRFEAGYLVAELDLARVADWLSPVVASGEDVYVVDGKGRLVARTGAAGTQLQDLSADPIVSAAVSRQLAPTAGRDPLTGAERFMASQAVPQLGWYVIALRSGAAAAGEVEATLNQLLLSRLLLVAVLLVGSVLMARTGSQVVAQRNENVRLVTAIRETSAQLEIASRHKSEFLANMSHELRTPLNAIIGFSDVLRQGMVGELSDKQTEYMDDVLVSARHLLALINDILDLSKVEAGRMELELSSFSLREAVDNGVMMVRERAARAGVVLGATVASDVDEIEADQRKLKQVLFNLLTNAVKFTPNGGHVDVAAARVDGQIQVSVRDSGIGIAPEDQERVFEE
ncbi:MAG TPA: histidine kinase dimerization/phospho-acceptor domain-containing protein, partial [Candidatus Limnocylindria bacterium]|nr:histidine kinase dimerization/phospho-acceptor domain-containing protein [Candidatus Limnocylindria bacterium]